MACPAMPPMWPNGVTTAVAPRSAASSGPVLMPSDVGSILLFGSIVCEKRLKPNRVSSSVWSENVEFQTTQTTDATVGSVTELNMSTGPTDDGGVISPLLPAGADWKLRP